MSHSMRVLRLKSFTDVNESIKEHRFIELMATLGVFQGESDGSFLPNAPVTRLYLTKFMAQIMELEPLDETPIFSDVDLNDPNSMYIQVAIQEGLISAQPDGSFRPNQPLTLNQIIDYLSNARIIRKLDVEDGDRVVTRKVFAEFLSLTPQYEIQIDELLDWETGYYEDE